MSMHAEWIESKILAFSGGLRLLAGERRLVEMEHVYNVTAYHFQTVMGPRKGRSIPQRKASMNRNGSPMGSNGSGMGMNLERNSDHLPIYEGVLTLTNYQLHFAPTIFSTYDDVLDPNLRLSRCSIPLASIARLVKANGDKTLGSEHSNLLEIQCKDFRLFRFSLAKARDQIFLLLQKECFSGDIESLFAFSNREQINTDATESFFNLSLEEEEEGDELNSMSVVADSSRFNIEIKDDFIRLGALSGESGQYGPWRLARVNDGQRYLGQLPDDHEGASPSEDSSIPQEPFSVCPSYPRQFLVPLQLSDEDIVESSKFRSRGRHVLLSWFDAAAGVSICRSAQPMTGVFRSSNSADQRFLECVRVCNRFNPEYLLVLDLRPKLNAVLNHAVGAGYELSSQYPGLEIRFLDIPNVHAVQASFKAVYDLSFSSKTYATGWLSALESTKWLEYIQIILNATAAAVESVERDKFSILVHCSDGWDRTAQICSLAGMCLDEYYRTMDGFMVLLEREWISYGHQLHSRVGHGQAGFFDEKMRGPVFVQFMDCVWQLTQQFPCSFEYNERFLLDILDHLYSCRFGTFLCDNEREREEHDVRRRCPSLWSYLRSRRRRYLNPFFVATSNIVVEQTDLGSTQSLTVDMGQPADGGLLHPLSVRRQLLYSDVSLPSVLHPEVLPGCFKFWKNYYLRHVHSIMHTVLDTHADAFYRTLEMMNDMQELISSTPPTSSPAILGFPEGSSSSLSSSQESSDKASTFTPLNDTVESVPFTEKQDTSFDPYYSDLEDQVKYWKEKYHSESNLNTDRIQKLEIQLGKAIGFMDRYGIDIDDLEKHDTSISDSS